MTFCPIPFDHLNKGPTRFATCCPGWLDGSRFIYDGWRGDMWRIWNHSKLIELRAAILRGDWRYCRKCPNRYRPQRQRRDDDQAIMQRPPVTLGFADNATCNLACPSCRRHVIRESTRAGPSVREAVNGFDGEVPTVALSLGGDPFANSEHLQFMQSAGPEELILWTNGILLPRLWHTIRRRVSVLITSIDAATRDTYEALRRPAKWWQIQDTLRFCSDLIATDELDIWQCNFVVQSRNFREMPRFVEMCESCGATSVQFCLIAPWEHITPTEWRAANIADPSHPDHAEYLSVLRSPQLRRDIVDSGFVSPAASRLVADFPAASNYFSMTR